MRRCLPLLLLAFPAASPARAQDLMELLQRGPLVLVEYDEAGRLSQATAVQAVDAPVEKVWAVVSDLAGYKDIMPRMRRSDAVPVAGRPGQVDVTFELEVPGPNPDYTLRYTLEPSRREVSCVWLRGDLKGSRCQYRLVPQGSRTLVYYTTLSKNYSSLAESLEDEGQTVTIGVNVGAALAAVKAVRKKAEAAAR